MTDARPAELLTAREVAEILKVSAYTVRKWVRQDKIQAAKPNGRNIRFEPEAVKRFIRESSSY